MDLTNMTLDELKKLHKEVGREIDGYEARQIAIARADLEKRAKEYGLTLKQIVGASGVSIPKPPAVIRYQNPDNPSETWAGRGRKPKWLTAKLDAGRTMEDFAV